MTTSVLDREIRSGRVNQGGDGISGMLAGRERQVDGIVIDNDGGDGGAVFPDHIVNFPAIGIALAREITVVANNVAGDFLYAARDELVGKFSEDPVRRAVELFLCFERKLAIGKIGIASTNENEIAGQRAGWRQDTIDFQGGAEAIVHSEFVQRKSGGE